MRPNCATSLGKVKIEREMAKSCRNDAIPSTKTGLFGFLGSNNLID